VRCEKDGKSTINPTIVTSSMMVVESGLPTMAKDITDPKQLNNHEPSDIILHDYHDMTNYWFNRSERRNQPHFASSLSVDCFFLVVVVIHLFTGNR
jgi:hypothetical protein